MRIRDSNRIDEFEALRGFMALWVVAGHVIHTVDIGLEPAAWLRLLARNPYAVNVFIAISGFVIYALLDHKHETYKLYIARRAIRLFPAYIFFLVVSISMLPIALNVLAPDVASNPRAATRFTYLAEGQEEFWPHLLGHLALLHGLLPQYFLPNAAYTFLGQAWSISVEWQFYLLAPMFYFSFERHPLLSSLGMLAASFATHYCLSEIANQGFVGFYLHYFLIGILSYLIWRQRMLLPAWQIWGIILTCIVGAVAALRIELSLSIWLAAFAATLLLHQGKGGRLVASTRILASNPVAQFFGRISYSVYLSHMVVLYLVIWVIRSLWPDRPLELGTLMVATMGGTLLLSHLTYVWLERPCIEWGKSLLALRRATGMADTASSPG